MKEFQDNMLETLCSRTVPQVFINGKHVGDCSKVTALYNSGELKKIIEAPEIKFDYKFAVIGGGSGGCASIKVFF